MEERTLFELTSEMREIENELWDNGGELTPELELAMTYNREATLSKVDGYGCLLRKFKSSGVALAEEIKRLQAMKKTVANAEKRLKERLEYNMRVNEIDVLEGRMTRVSFRKNPPSVEVDEDVVLAGHQHRIDEFIASLPSWIKVDISVSKDAIKQLYKDTGILPEGAEIVQGESLNIR